MNKIITPIIQTSVRGLCCSPYPNHPKGCPNYGKKISCPPTVPCFEDIFDLTKICFAIWTTFPFGEHVDKMRRLHPNWSERQLTCCLYWQGTARKHLKTEICMFKKLHPDYAITTCPEAMGINVTATMAAINEYLEWPPKTTTYQIALAGITISEMTNICKGVIC